MPELKTEHVNPPQFEKMRANIAGSFFSERMSAGLSFAAIHVPEVSREAESTGWFIGQVSEWKRLMNARHEFDSLSRSLQGRERVKFLQEYLVWFRALKFHPQGGWKPTQTGTLLLTTAAIEMMEDLVMNRYIEYLLSSRLGSHSCENVFSQVRAGGNIHPGPVRLRQMLRLLSVAQFMAVPSSATYPEDEERYYVDFLVAKKDKPIEGDEEDPLLYVPESELTLIQRNGLYFMAGWAVKEILGDCATCNLSVRSGERMPGLPSEWTNFYSHGGLIHPTKEAFDVVKRGEKLFMGHGDKLLKIQKVKKVLKDEIIQSVPHNIATHFPACHNIMNDLVCKYISLRLHILAKDTSKRFVQDTVYSSKSGFMFTSSAKVGKSAKSRGCLHRL